MLYTAEERKSTKTVSVGHYPYKGPFDDIPKELEGAFRWWKRYIEMVDFPTRGAIKFQDLVGWHAHMTITEIEPDLTDMRAIIVGEQVADAFGGRLSKGTPYVQAIGVTPDAQRQYLVKLAKDQMVITNFGKMKSRNNRLLNVHAVDFPLFDRDGTRITHAITLYDIQELDGSSF